ncbi:MAG: hypothetical protein AAGE52_35310 [Myxococcota bacterium]
MKGDGARLAFAGAWRTPRVPRRGACAKTSLDFRKSSITLCSLKHFFGNAQAFLDRHSYEDNCAAETAFRKMAFRKAIWQVDEDGLFGTLRDELVLAIWWGDQSNFSRIAEAKVLNPRRVWKRMVTKPWWKFWA